MPNKKTAEQKLAEAVNELGIEKAESLFQFLKHHLEHKAPSERQKKQKEKAAITAGGPP